MLQRLRESLVLVLLAALPFHALAVTLGTYSLNGPDQAPLALIALWKEALLALIIFVAVIEILKNGTLQMANGKWNVDALDICIAVAFLWSILLLIIFNFQFSIFNFLYGFKYDFLPLVAFLILRRVLWSRAFFHSAMRVVIVVGGIVAVIGLVSLFVPLPFFMAIGYSDLHSMYRPGAPLAAFQFLEGTDIRRIQSVMSGPNQLGLWMLLPLAASLQKAIVAWKNRRRSEAFGAAGFFILFCIAIVLTFSRSASIAAAVIVLACVWMNAQRKRLLVYWFTSVLVLVAIGVAVAPQVFVRVQSLKGHVEKPLEALQMIREHPFGLGLGSAGPASNRLSDTCLFFDADADTAWAEGRTDICVFVGGEQKIPTGKICDCPLLTENWYLQWGVEMGVIGLLISLLIPLLIMWKWKIENGKLKIEFEASDQSIPVLLAFLGICIAGLFLHSFEDSAVAYTVWTLLAATGLKKI